MKLMRLCLLLSLSVLNVEAVIRTRGDLAGPSGSWISKGTPLEIFGISVDANNLNEGYDCLDRACRMSVTNALGIKDAGVVQLLDRAESIFSNAVSTLRFEPAARVGWASVIAARGNKDKALACVDAGLVKYPANAHLLNCRGWLLMKSGRLEEAIASYRKALSGVPATPLPYLGLAEALNRTWRYEEAVTLCKEAFQRWPDDERIADIYLKSLTNFERFDEAKTLCKSLMNGHPQWARLFYRRGQLLVAVGDVKEAIPDFEAYAKLNPLSCDAFLEMGYAWSILSDYQRAHDCYQAGLQVHPQCPHTLWGIGRCYLQQGEVDKAVDVLKIAYSLIPTDEWIASAMASAFLAKGDAAAALGICTNAIAGQPWAWNLSFKASECLIRLGRREDALRFAEMGIAAAKHDSGAWSLYGYTVYSYGMYDKAAEAYGEAARLNPHELSYVLYQASSLARCNRVEQLVDVCRAAQLRFPNNIELKIILGQGLEQLGRYQEAIDCYNAITISKPATDRDRFWIESAWGGLGNICLVQRHYVQARDAFATADRLGGTNVQWTVGEVRAETLVDFESAKRKMSAARVRYGDSPLLLKEWANMALREPQAKEREAVLDVVLSKAPGDADVRFVSGCLAISLGRVSQAVTHWEEAVRLNPNMSAPYNEIGKAMAQMGESPQRVIPWFKKAVELAPSVSESRSNLGYAYYSGGAYTNAVCELEKAVALDPSMGLAWYNLALVHFALGQYEEASNAVSKANQAGFKGDAAFIRRLDSLQKKISK
jgi:tetratricopeptide (TPR) repeat protein